MDPAVTDGLLADIAETVLRISREIDPNGASALDIVPLTGTEALVMRWVDLHPGTSPSVTASATALQRSNLSAALRSLVAKGMVDRRTDPRDARLVQLFPTELAAANIARLRRHWVRELRSALGADAHARDDDRDHDLTRDRDALARTLAVLTRIDDGLRG